MIAIKNINKTYGDNVVLERVSAEVEEGEFVTLVGASGCGKSTFLKMLLGTEVPTKGSLLLDDQPVPNEPDASRGIVFQQYSVFPHMTVLANVLAARGFLQPGITGRLWGAKRKKAQQDATTLLKEVGLEHAMDKYPHELSGGMRQRLAIAQALLDQPRILLLDEPFGALDPGIRADMHKLVLRLWKQQGLTVFMVTHDLQEAFHLGTRLWVFDKVRHDPDAPQAYGATITYDLPVAEVGAQEYQKMQAELGQSLPPFAMLS